jgi:predicted nucleotidyltransferase
MNFLNQLLSSRVRSEIFRLLFDRRNTSIHLREIQRQSGLAIGTIQNEIKKLRDLDLVVSKQDGNRLYYSANSQHPIYNEICTLVEKTVGVGQELKSALQSIKGIECAFVFGSFAKGSEKSHSDIDLIIIGSLGLRHLSSKLKSLTFKFGREINPHVYSKKTWLEKLKRKDHFATSVLAEKKVFLIGDERVIG